MINATTIEYADRMRDAGKTKLLFDLDEAYSELVMAKPRDDRSGVFHPSSIGFCGRRSVYEYLSYDAQNNFDEWDLEIFDMGHGVHDLVQGKLAQLSKVLEPKGIKIEFTPELRRPDIDVLHDDLGTGGTTDGLFKIWKPKVWTQRSILEVKSMKDEFWQQLKKPKDDHRMQATLYAFRFNCPIIYFWYYNKNTSRRKVYTELFDREVFKAAVAKLAEWKDYADRGELPPREESWYGCPRCAYNHHCKPQATARQSSKASNAAISHMRKAGLFGGGKKNA
jgi:CRISPR/Cas system-associated exonuclease Cas4 (RecB family)